MSDPTKSFPNYAGRDDADVDDALAAELNQAGIFVCRLPGVARDTRGGVQSTVRGHLLHWSFERAWRFWVCKGPGIEIAAAERLHESFGREARVDGHCGCPSPRDAFDGLAVGHYHVDTQRGLNALAATIRGVVNAPAPGSPGNPAQGETNDE